MLNILVVEDEEIIRKGLISTFDWERLGCRVVAEAKDGRQGLSQLKKYKPDIVITDIRMPLMSGIEMVEQAQSFAKFHTIFVTSYAEFSYAKKGIDLGISNYILKPIDENELEEAIEKIKEDIGSNLNPNLQAERAGGNYYVEKTYEIIQKDYANKLSILDISEELGVSKSYLSRVLKKHLGTGFMDILNQYRIQKAMEMLEDGGLKIYEISDKLGFCDYKHFCTVFKKYTRKSPGEYLKRGRLSQTTEK